MANSYLYHLITYKTHTEIDKTKWDACIENSCNNLVYAYSWFLDVTCNEPWDALVEGDYEAVFPLTWRKKFGITYLYQPFFSNQLGVFSPELPTEKKVTEFFAAIPKKFQYFDFGLNYANNFFIKGYKYTRKTIQLINLDTPHDLLVKFYSENLKRNIKKAKANGYQLKYAISASEVVGIFKKSVQGRLKDFKEKDYQVLERLIDKSIEMNHGETVAVVDSQGNTLAAAAFLKGKDRIIYLKGGSTDEGKEQGAMHFLMDEYIQKYNKQKLLLDFGGSSVHTVARFYRSFGSADYHHFDVKKNKLPLLIKWLKR